MATILVVDDDLGSRSLLSEILSDEGHVIALAENAAQARAYCDGARPDLVLLDLWMPDVDGITLLKEWSSNSQLTMPVIVLGGDGSIDTAIDATKYGAMAFLDKPITLQKLLRSVEQSLINRAPGVTTTAAATQSGTRLSVEIAPTNAAMSPRAPSPLCPKGEQTFDLDRPLRLALGEFERSYFEFHLAQEHGSMMRVAEKTGIERTHLYRKLKQLGVHPRRYQEQAVGIVSDQGSALP
jgi:DNA-binding NtrC family response regulator